SRKAAELPITQAGSHPGNRSLAVFDSDSGDEQNEAAGPLPPVMVCVARQVAVKNLGLLLDACALLAKRGARFHCVLVGDGTCRGELEAARARLGLAEIVQMPGAAEQSRVLAGGQGASIGVLTSGREGMPGSLMEAAACGVPVVATSVGGVPELVEDEVTGLLVAPGNVPALASALERLLMDQALRKRMGDAARQRAEEKFSVVRQVDQLLGLWSEIQNAGGATPGFVSDTFGAPTDRAMPTRRLAAHPRRARNEL